MSNEIFILGLSDNKLFMQGLRELASEVVPGRKFFFKVRHVTLIELMNIDSSYRFNKKNSVAIVPVHMYDALHIFAGMGNIKMVPANISLSAFSSLLSEVLISKVGLDTIREKNNVFLTAKERKYCYLVYNGISNKNIARYFQCTEKNISYLKRKIMSKWQCKNSLDFYKTINYFYNDDDTLYSERNIA